MYGTTLLNQQTSDNRGPSHQAQLTNDCVRNEDMEKAIAVEVELKQCWHSLTGSDGELSISICTAGYIHTISQQVKCPHDHIFWVPWKAKIKIPGQDLLLHAEEVLHQLGEHHPLKKRDGEKIQTRIKILNTRKYGSHSHLGDSVKVKIPPSSYQNVALVRIDFVLSWK